MNEKMYIGCSKGSYILRGLIYMFKNMEGSKIANNRDNIVKQLKIKYPKSKEVASNYEITDIHMLDGYVNSCAVKEITDDEISKLKEMKMLFEKIESIYKSFTTEIQWVIKDVHAEGYELPHCIEWGIKDCDDLIPDITKHL
jgi:hypothetical protein